RAQELVDNLGEQIKIFDPTVVLGQSIEKIDRLEDKLFKLTSHTGEEHLSKTIIITAGNGAFEPRRLNINACENFEGVNLHYHVDDMNRYKDEHVMLLGGGDSAVDWALMLEPIAKKVTLVHRRDQFRAHEHSIEQLNNSSADILTPFNATSITTNDKIETITLKEARGDREIILYDDFLLCYYE